MARYKRYNYNRPDGEGGANRVPSGDHDPIDPNSRPGTPDYPYRPGAPDEELEKVDHWWDGIVDFFQGIDDFLDGPDSSPTITEIGSDGTETDITSRIDIHEIIRRIKQTDTYVQAYNLFSSSPDYSMFLQRLQAIIDGVNTTFNSWSDKLGFANNYEDSIQEAYNHALEQIQALLAEFHQWKNSLPSTQVDQLSQAGVNAAITGANLSPSSLNPQTVSRHPMASSNPMEALSFIGDVALNKIPSIVSTVSGVVSTIKQTRLANRIQDFSEKTALAGFKSDLIKNGYVDLAKNMENFEDFNSVFSYVHNDSKVEKQFYDSKVQALFSRWTYKGLQKYDDAPVSMGYDDTAFERDFGVTFESFYNSLAEFQIKQLAASKEFEYLYSQNQRDYQYYIDVKDQANAENAYNRMKKSQSDFNKKMIKQSNSFVSSWIKKVNDSNDFLAKYALLSLLLPNTVPSPSDVASGFGSVLGNVVTKKLTTK